MTREQLLINLMKYIRLPYLWGGKNPSIGLDCSGLVWNILVDLDIAPPGEPRNAQGLMNYFIKEATPVILRDRDLGDLAFFGDENKIHHVGMCLNSDLMIEAAHGDETVTSVEIAKEKGAYVQVNSLYRLNDLFCILRPNQLRFRQ